MRISYSSLDTLTLDVSSCGFITRDSVLASDDVGLNQNEQRVLANAILCTVVILIIIIIIIVMIMSLFLEHLSM